MNINYLKIANLNANFSFKNIQQKNEITKLLLSKFVIKNRPEII